MQAAAGAVVEGFAEGHRLPALSPGLRHIAVENVDQIVVPPRTMVGQGHHLAEPEKVIVQVVEPVAATLTARFMGVSPLSRASSRRVRLWVKGARRWKATSLGQRRDLTLIAIRHSRWPP